LLHGQWSGVDSAWEQKKLEATHAQNARKAAPSVVRFFGLFLFYSNLAFIESDFQSYPNIVRLHFFFQSYKVQSFAHL
jgi:hypothetical protein